MNNLSNKAKIYISVTILGGLVLLVQSLRQLDWEKAWILPVLIAAASISLLLKVEGTTNHTHYNVSFLIYAFSFVLFGPSETILVILVSNIIDWAWHKYPWYIQSFNISSYIILIFLADIVFRLVNPGGGLYSVSGMIGIISAIAAFTLFNHLMVGLVIWLARGENFARSGVLAVFPLMLDFTLLGMGAMTALIWLANPYGTILALLPLYLIYSTLKVPALERQSELDPKTGLYNARYFEHALQDELNRANRFDRPMTIVMADLDLLRNINNTYGHLAGDKVLIGVANILKDAVREYDVVVRFGGEEYAILMPETSPVEAFSRIESMRTSIEEAEFNIPTNVTPIKATMSFGIAGRIGFDQTPSDIVHNADAALYYAKLKGRNGTFIYSEEGFVGLRENGHRLDVDPGHESRLSQSGENLPFRPSPLRQAPVIDLPGEKPARSKQAGEFDAQLGWKMSGVVLASAVFALVLYSLADHTPLVTGGWGLGLFMGMVILTEWLSIDIGFRSPSISISAAPLMAGVLIYGATGALLLSAALALVTIAKYRSPTGRFVLNFSNQMIPAMLYTLILQVAGVRFGELHWSAQLLLCMTFIVLVYLMTTLLVSIVTSLDLKRRVLEVWWEKFSGQTFEYLALGFVAYALYFAQQSIGWLGSVAVFFPLLLLRISQTKVLYAARSTISELRAKNLILEKGAQDIRRISEGLLDTLAAVIDLRDPHVLGHSKHVAQYAVRIGRKLGLPRKQIELIRKSGLLHDIGKLGIADGILFKPEALTAEEYRVVQGHVTVGADLLQTSGSLSQLIPIIRHHHERYDGGGYPDGLTGNEIPLEARVIAVADAIESMASDKPYRIGRGYQEIIAELGRNSGTQFDPMVVNAFLELAQVDGEAIIVNAGRRAAYAERVR